MGRLKVSGKPFDISKREVWEAYEKVKANKGAPGVDGCSIDEFEKDLKSNLYKIWNRMSSGSYFPPPVLAVEYRNRMAVAREFSGFLPSPTGSRKRSPPAGWRRRSNRSSIRTPTGTGLPGRRWMRWDDAGNAAGGMTG
jgi:hypothetical protein